MLNFLKQKSRGITLLVLGLLVLAIFWGAYILGKRDSADNKFILKEEKFALKIGFLTDAHCYAKEDKDSGEWILNWRCQEPLDHFVSQMNDDFKPDLIIEGGDLIDGKDDRPREDVVEVLDKYYSKLRAPIYYVLGNHETREFSKGEWLDLVNQDKTYFKVDIKGYRVFILDGNFVPTGGDTTPERQYYPGVVTGQQKKWLEENLKNAGDLKKIVFIHQPPIDTDNRRADELFNRGDEFRKLLADHDVLAVFSGHNERFCKMEYDGVDYYAIQGLWKPNRELKKEFQFKDKGVFSEISIVEDGVMVKSFFREKGEEESEMMIVGEEGNANCEDGSLLAPETTRR